jgi:Zn-finger domain-containing protein
MQEQGIENILLQDQGGWITYKQFAKKFKLNIIELKTDHGLINNISNKTKSALLINSMPSYAYLQDMDKIEKQCKKNKTIIINDTSGSIGQEQGTIGDLIFASFGKNKPVNLGQGSFIATDNKEFYDVLNDINRPKIIIDFDKLHDKLINLKQRINKFNKTNKKIKEELKDHDIIHENKLGFNVIVKYKNESELSKITSYCENNKYEFVLCPKYIKVLEQAVSIEVVRL